MTYFTSSEYVRDYVNEYGDPDIKEIRKTFASGDSHAAMEWEHNVLKKINAVNRTDYLNKSYSKGIPPMFGDQNPMNLPGVRDKHKAAVSNTIAKEKKSVTSKEVWQRPGHRELQSEVRKKAWQESEQRQHEVSRQFSALWDNPDYRAAQVAKRKEKWQDPDYHHKMTLNRQGKNNGRYDSTLYVFEHTDGSTEISSRFDLINKYNLNKGSMCGVVKNHGTVHKGWKCNGVYCS